MQRKYPNYSFAFQPIVDVRSGIIISYEALVRGVNNESAYYILQQINQSDKHDFDEQLRISAIQLATQLGIDCSLNLNMLSGSPELSASALESTLTMAEQRGISPEHLTIEITEQEIIHDYDYFIEALNIYRGLGIKVSIDDFGAGYSGLNLLAEFQPDNIKLDMSLVRDIDTRGPRQAIIRGIITTCTDLGIDIIAEGVESIAEYWWFREEGIDFYQGYLIAKPGFEHLPLAFYPQSSL